MMIEQTLLKEEKDCLIGYSSKRRKSMLAEQVSIFGWSILTGAVLGVLFDLFRGLRWEGIKDIWVYIQDVVFWIVTALIIIVSAFLMNQGEIRGYMLIGYLLGAGFYLLTISKYILGIFKFINKKVRQFFNLIFINIKKIKSVKLFNKKMSKNIVNKQEI